MIRHWIGLAETLSIHETEDADDPDRDLFTAGYCHALAIALSRKTKLPMVALMAREGRRWAIIHVLVLVDDDEYLDIDGLHHGLGDVLYDAGIDEEETATQIVPASEADLKRWTTRGLVPITPEIAEKADAAAERVLSKLQ